MLQQRNPNQTDNETRAKHLIQKVKNDYVDPVAMKLYGTEYNSLKLPVVRNCDVVYIVLGLTKEEIDQELQYNNNRDKYGANHSYIQIQLNKIKGEDRWNIQFQNGNGCYTSGSRISEEKIFYCLVEAFKRGIHVSK